eukprot:1157526-Pelagomonas_calceolata.AAC.4
MPFWRQGVKSELKKEEHQKAQMRAHLGDDEGLASRAHRLFFDITSRLHKEEEHVSVGVKARQNRSAHSCFYSKAHQKSNLSNCSKQLGLEVHAVVAVQLWSVKKSPPERHWRAVQRQQSLFTFPFTCMFAGRNQDPLNSSTNVAELPEAGVFVGGYRDLQAASLFKAMRTARGDQA